MTVTADTIDPREAYRLCERQVPFRPRRDDDTPDAVTDGRTLEGYAAVFDAATEIDSYEGVFEESIARGAFRRTLRQRQPVLQFNHGRDKRTGAVPIGSIQALEEDEQGLFVRARMFDNELVEPIRQAIEGKAIRGMSFKFEVLRDRWMDLNGIELTPDQRNEKLDAGETIRREITEVKLYELGPVVFPAYEQTTVGVRDLPAGSPFDPSRVAVRGVLAQFGLDERCVQRHLSIFDEEARQALADEIVATFPEIQHVLQQRTAVGPHDSGAEEGEWDASANESRLPSPMTVETARNFYAWFDDERVEDGQMPKAAGKLPHHFVNADGTPGAASVNGVRNALARLPQTEGLSEEERETIERHLRAHLPDDNEASSEPAAGTSDTKTDPVSRHSVDHLREPADWYLPGPSEVL